MSSLTGLTSKEALLRLHEDICGVENDFTREGKGKPFNWLHHNNRYVSFHWTSLLVAFLCFICLVAAYACSSQSDGWLLVEAVFLATLTALNLCLSKCDDQMRHREIAQKIQKVLQKIKACSEGDPWEAGHYVGLHCPLSPCVSLQWTLRDGELVNLPVPLLVQGDLIYLRPGHCAPARCRQSPQEVGSNDEGLCELNKGDVYQARLEDGGVSCGGGTPRLAVPRSQKLLSTTPFIALETPFLENIRLMLKRGSSRPTGLLSNERFASYTVYIERILIPAIFCSLLLVNSLRYFLLDETGHWAEMLLSYQVQAVLPLTSLFYPVMWRALEFYGTARIQTVFETFLYKRSEEKGAFDEDSLSVNSETQLKVERREVWRRFKAIVRGHSDILPRTCPLVQTLGCMTDFCCVDKKGILSWPNPTAEKVFFIRDNTENSKAVENQKAKMNRKNTQDLLSDDNVTFEVLDLTQNYKNGSLQFDDPMWQRYLTSLKPLGLNILLNTCNLDTVEDYTEFADHVTCIAARQEAAVPVVNRRCFCELSKAMGFTDRALDIFQFEQVLGIYRPVESHLIQKEASMRGKPCIKYRMPMPNAFSVVAREVHSGMSQLFSQGTGDLLLDACSDFWDGKQLKPLCSSDRRKIIDFYHRTSMGAYCTAFAYRPLMQPFSEQLDEFYIEVPHYAAAELCDVQPSPAPFRSVQHAAVDEGSAALREVEYHGSADSIILGTSLERIHDVHGCLSSQCNQVFIGLISMQYQAKTDIVRLIEDLDDACIRFIHFSKENELRSRVFSEKMGLEAGWNCLISLLSDPSVSAADLSHVSTETLLEGASGEAKGKDKLGRRRNTAPGAINTMQPLVKFEDTIQEYSGASSDKENGALAVGEPGAWRDSAPTGYTRIAVNEDEPGQDIERVQFFIDADSVQLTSTPYGAAPRPSPRKHGSASATRPPGGSVPGTPSKQLTSREDIDIELSPKNDCSEPLLSGYKQSVSPPPDRSRSENLFLNRSERRRLKKRRSSKSTAHKTNSPNNEAQSGGAERTGSAVTSQSGGSEEAEGGEEAEDEEDEEASLSGSYPPSSFITEHTDSITALGLSNRAKLPKGIENIRPHLERVDNVPLLVSLFTDCLPHSTAEMLEILKEYATAEMMEIMQEYGEVVFCFGSSANVDNTCIFLQADCTLGVEPLYPQLCQRVPAVSQTWVESGLTPGQLSALLVNIPCALSCSRDENFSLMNLIALARHHCHCMRTTFLLLLLCELHVSLLLLLSAALLPVLPPPLAPHQLLWLAWGAAPALALTMMTARLQPDIVKQAQGKNLPAISKGNVGELILYVTARLLPSLSLSLLTHTLTLWLSCCPIGGQLGDDIDTGVTNSSNTTVSSLLWPGSTENSYQLSLVNSTTAAPSGSDTAACTCSFWWTLLEEDNSAPAWRGWFPESSLRLSQNIVTFQTLLSFIFSSMCFVHRRQHLWQRAPFTNKLWGLTSLVIFLLQLIYTCVHMQLVSGESRDQHHVVPLWVVVLITCLVPLLVVSTHELVKRREIKVAVRYQKRARLHFGTKLGMNSPF